MKLRLPSFSFFACLAACLLGAFLRLDQFFSQVLIDDEWHALHQLMESSPARIVTSFGHADYSIPLTLLYWVEMRWFGLSEWLMRWPMIVCGLITLAAFPMTVRYQFGKREAALFATLLAVSPLLVIYSRTARPYAVTLLLGYMAIHAFHNYRNNNESSRKYGILYGVTSTLCAWLHPLTIPWVAAPCLIEFFAVIALPCEERRCRLQRLFILGVPTAVAMMVFVLPPLLADPGTLGSKLGVDSPTWGTLIGASHLWFGTGSSPALLIGFVLCSLGARRLWKTFPTGQSTIIGMALTVGLIFLVRPAWVHHPLTFGRYLLPLLPLLLLSVALGAIRLADKTSDAAHKGKNRLHATLLLLPVLILAVQSPVFTMLRSPNTNTLHLLYQFDLRPDYNVVRRHFDALPLSPFWRRMRSFPENSLRIAVAPWFFESYDWYAPRWEREGWQPVVPAYLTGFCLAQRRGEPARDARFALRNGVFLYEIPDSGTVDVLVFQKPFAAHAGVATNYTSDKIPPDCLTSLVARLGAPDYEDDTILAFLLSPTARASLHAQRE